FGRGLSRAMRRESWGRHVLQLAWTAGPVTYLALQGGYYLAYGEPAPPAIFFYFGGYTVVAGVAALIVRVFYQATRGEQRASEERQVEAALAELPRLVLLARDHALQRYSENDAPLVGARHLLQNPDASELAVAVAIRDLGGSRDLAYTFQRIEVFRRNGMMSRAQSERRESSRQIDALIENVAERSPETASLVRERSFGLSPDKARGRTRVEGFIERALAAESKDDTSFLTLADVEEVLGLVIELVAGRSFLLVTFHFEGDRKIKEAWSDLERARKEFRTKRRARDSRLRRVAESLSHRMAGYVPGNPLIGDTATLVNDSAAALTSWHRELSGLRLRRVGQGERDRFKIALAAWRRLEEADRALQRTHKRLLVTAEHYERVVADRKNRSREAASQNSRARGVRAEQREIELSEAHQRSVAKRIFSLISLIRREDANDPQIAPLRLRTFAVDLIAELERIIPLYRTDVQQAIELSRAPIFTSLEPGLSQRVRVEWARALVSEVADDTEGYLRKRIGQLIRFHALILDEGTRRRLARQLDIKAEELPEVSTATPAAEPPWAHPPVSVPPISAELLS
ncbi:MAG: hypothetical protein ACLFNT_05360, partial [Spirochaetales bacterium]